MIAGSARKLTKSSRPAAKSAPALQARTIDITTTTPSHSQQQAQYLLFGRAAQRRGKGEKVRLRELIDEGDALLL